MSIIWKRSISLILAMVMVFGMLPMNAFATETEEAASVTEAPVTETPETETPATEVPTEDLKEAPTEVPTEAPVTETPETEASATEAPTEAPTETPTEAPTVPVETEAEEPAQTEAVAATITVEETVTDPVMGEEAAEADAPVETVVDTLAVEQAVASEAGYSNEEMFAMYVERLLYPNKPDTLGTAGRDALDAKHQKLYTDLKSKFVSVAAAGGSTSYAPTVEEMTGFGFTMSFDAAALGTENLTVLAADVDALKAAVSAALAWNVDAVVDALLADCPYEMYWYDKVTGCTCGYDIQQVGYTSEGVTTITGINVTNVTMGFAVSANYASAAYTVDSSAASKAAGAVTAAETIVETHKDKTDYEKLVAYRDDIMGSVSYNTQAATNNSFVTNSDPWQLIYVFDGDSETNVVCEGYSKAFQYLCDLSTFEDETFACYTAMGMMSSGSESVTGEAEAHMWNIVTLGGENYLVDVTNSEDETIGSDGSLFLAGAAPKTAGDYKSGYSFACTNGITANYFYYLVEDGVQIWPSVEAYGDEAENILTLSETSYDPDAETETDTPATETVEGMTEAKLLEALEATEKDGWYHLTSAVTISGTLTLPENVSLGIDGSNGGKIIVENGGHLIVSAGNAINPYNGASVVVKAGGQMTISDGVYGDDGEMTTTPAGMGVSPDSTVTIEDGGKLTNYGTLDMGGTLTVENSETGYVHGSNAEILETGTINGIDQSLIYRMAYAASEDTIRGCLDELQAIGGNYKSRILSVNMGENGGIIEITGGDLNIPSGITLRLGTIEKAETVLNFNSGLHIQEGGALEVYGQSRLSLNYLNNWGTLYLASDEAGFEARSWTNGNQLQYNKLTNARFTHELEARLGYGNGYTLNQEMILDEDLTLDYGGYTDILVGEGGHLVVPEDKTLTIVNNSQLGLKETGKLTVYGTLNVQEDSWAVAVEDEAELTVPADNTIPAGAVVKIGDAVTIHNITNDNLAAICFVKNAEETMAALDKVESYWYLEIYLQNSATLAGVDDILTIPEKSVLIITAGETHEPSVVTIPSGTTVDNKGILVIQESNTMVVESGAAVHNYGKLNNLGALYLMGGEESLILDPDSTYHNNAPITPETAKPYLSYTYVYQNNEGWFENTDGMASTETVMAAGDEMCVVFYLNTWNSERKVWERTPVMPTSADANILSVEKLDVAAANGQANSAYFASVKANAWCPEGLKLSTHVSEGVDAEMTVYIDRLDAGFYTAQPDFANMTEDQLREIYMSHLEIDPLDESTWTFYFGVDRGWTLQDGKEAMVTNGADRVAFEKVVDNVYKITVNENAAKGMWSGNGLYFLQVVFDAQQTNAQGDTQYQTLYGNLNVDANWPGEPLADLYINGEQYAVFDSGVATYTSNGPVMAELPEGVAYDVKTNTMTLTNANLNQLRLSYEWQGTDQNGNYIEGTNLPNGDVKLVLVGENTISCDDGQALEISGGVNLTISGDGSLYLKADNGDGRQNESGDYYCFDAVNLYNGCSLTIDSGDVTVEIAGTGKWGDGNYGEIGAIWGDGGSLTLNGGSLTTKVPGRNHINNNVEGNYWGGTVGLKHFGNITVNGGTLNTSTLYMDWDREEGWKGSFTQTGGTVNIVSNGSEHYDGYNNENGEWTEGWQYSYIGIESWGPVRISGGETNITVMAADEERSGNSYFEGIKMLSSELDISGGKVTIINGMEVETEEEMADRGPNNGTAVWIGNGYDEWGNDQGGSTFNMSGGTLHVDTPGGFWNTMLDVTPDSEANFSGGYIYARNNEFYLGGTVNVTSENGKYVKWDLVYSFINADGTFNFHGGEINFAAESQFNANPGSEVQINGGKMNFTGMSSFNAYESPELNDGKLDFDNAVLIVHNAMKVNGGTITIDHDNTLTVDNFAYLPHNYNRIAFGLWIKAYLAIGGGTIIVNVAGDYPGIVNWGTFHQMGGTVTVNADKTTGKAMYDIGTTYVQNDAVLNLYGDVAYHQSPSDQSEGLNVNDQAVLNAYGQSVGLKLEGNAAFYGETSVNASAKGIPSNGSDSEAAYWPQAVTVEGIDGDSAKLTIDGGRHTFTATNTTPGTDAKVKGLSIYENGSVEVKSGKIVIDAEMPVYSRVTGGLQTPNKWGDGNDPIIENHSGDLLTMQPYSEDFSGVHVLKNGEGTTFDSVSIYGSSSCGVATGWQLQTYYEAYDPETGLPDTTTENGKQLIIGGSQYLYAYDMSSTDESEWTVPEWYNHKDFIKQISVYGVRNLSSYIFGNMENVVDIFVDKSVTEIDATAFYGCTALKTINYGGTEAQWNAAFKGTLPEGVTVNFENGRLDSHYPEFGITWLDNHGWGWLEEKTDSYGGNNICVGDRQYMIFYRNITSTDENGVQVLEDRIPVSLEDMTVSDPSKIRLTRIRDMEEESIADAQNNADYFVCMEALEGSWDSVVTISYGGYQVEVNIHRDEAGFYTSATPSNESWISHLWLNPLLDAEDGVVYFAFEGAEDQTVTEFVFAEDNDEWDNGEQYVDRFENVSDNIYAIYLNTGDYLNEGEVDVIKDSMRGDGLNFELKVLYRVNEGDMRECSMWFHNGAEDGRDAYFEVNGIGYEYHEALGGYIVFHEGHEDHLTGIKAADFYGGAVELGLDHENQTTTLTLENANLESMHLSHMWYDENSGNSGVDLPYENLNVVLIGSNIIENGTSEEDPANRTALEIQGNVKANISGDGTLLVQTWNNQSQWNDAFRIGNTELTIGGNAQVTVGVEGSAGDFLSPFRGCETGKLTITDNASLETVVLDDQEHDHRGLERFASITVEENATLITQGLYLNAAWEMGTEEAAKFIQTGGTAIINGHTSRSDNGDYHASGIQGRNGSVISITGGALSINTMPEGEGEFNRYNYSSTGITSEGGTVEIGGDTKVNINVWHMGDSLYVCGWGDEKGVFKMSGGTLTTMSSGDGETGALNIDWGCDAEITGGELNLNGAGINICSDLTISQASEETPVVLNAYCHMNIDNCVTVTIEGGELNLNEQQVTDENGNVCSSVAMDLHPGSTFCLNGGNLTAVNGTFFIGGEFNLNGGNLNIRDGNFYADNTLNVNGGKLMMKQNAKYLYQVNRDEMRPFQSQLEVNGQLNLNGGTVELNNVYANVNNELNLNGGIMNIKAASENRNYRENNSLDDDWQVAVRVNENARMTVRDGASFVMNASDFETILEIYGDYEQTGGYVNINDLSEDIPAHYAIVMAKGGKISGGSLSAEGANTGILVHYSSDDERTYQDGSKLVISGGIVVIGAMECGISLVRPMVVSGGSVSIGITGIQDDYPAGVNPEGVAYDAQSIQVGCGILVAGDEVDTYLNITGGSVDIDVPTEFNTDMNGGVAYDIKYTDYIGLYAFRNPINISGGVVKITAADSLVSMNDSFTDILNIVGMNVIDNENGNILKEVYGRYDYTGGTNYFRTFQSNNVFGPVTEEEIAEGWLFDAADSITIASSKVGNSSTYWSYDDATKTLRIYGNGAMDMSTSHSTPWEALRDKIRHIQIAEGVTTIGDNAFSNTAAEDVELADSVTTIGYGAFQSSANLKEIRLSRNVTEIGKSAFFNPGEELKIYVYHGSVAEEYANSNNLGGRIAYQHSGEDMVPHEEGSNIKDCKYGCGYVEIGAVNENMTGKEIMEKLPELSEDDTEELKNRIEEELESPDEETGGAAELVEKMDEAIKIELPNLEIAVEKDPEKPDFNDINDILEAPEGAKDPSIVGAAVNADSETTKVALVIGKPDTEVENLPSSEEITPLLTFTMTMEKTQTGSAAEELKDLKIPVTITLPVPEAYAELAKSGQLRILHYKNGDDQAPEVMAPLVTEIGGIHYATFVVSSFSTFSYAKPTPVKVIIGDQTVDLNRTPELSYTLTDADGKALVNDAEVREALGIQLGYTSTANAGEGEIFIAKVNKKCGYSIAEVTKGKLTVNKMAVAVSAIDATIKQGEEIPELGYTIAPGAAKVQVTITTDADPNVPGEYTITVTVNEEAYPNYDITVKNGTLTVKGSPSVIDRGKSLILKGEIYIKQYVAFENIGDYSQKDIIENAGMLVWEENKAPASIDEAIYGTQSYRVGLTSEGKYEGYDEYSAKTKGIPACEYGDVLYLRPYINIDGEYHYGDMVEYSVLAYCESRFEKSSNNDLKSMLVAMLNFGSAAQTYFNYKADSLVNSNFANYNLNEEWLAMNWSDDYLTPVNVPSEAMTVNFAKTDSVTDNGKSLYLKGLISVKYYMGVGNDGSMFENAEDSYYYFWTQEDYLALESSNTPLSKENASYKVKAELSYTSAYGYEYFAQSEGVPASEYGDTMYACFCVTDSTGSEHCSGMITYSPEQFASNKLNDGKATTIDPLLEWMVVYGERAKIYLN